MLTWPRALFIDIDGVSILATCDSQPVTAVDEIARYLASAAVPLIYVGSQSMAEITASRLTRQLPAAEFIISRDGDQIHERTADGLWQFVDRGVESTSARAEHPVAGRNRALRCVLNDRSWPAADVLYFGGSAADLGALSAGVRAMVGASLPREIARAVWISHHQTGWPNRLCFCQSSGVSGLLEGLQWFELVPLPSLPRPTRMGATPVSFQSTFIRVWAPERKSIRVHWQIDNEPRTETLQRHANGYHTGTIIGLGPNGRYQLQPEGRAARPDPVSRFQPVSVHGESQVIAVSGYPWSATPWKGISKRDLVVYELHLGAFTVEGTYRAAMQRIPELIELGVTAIELMPVAQTPGKWNWGYDGVHLFASRNTYGAPEEFKLFVDACHAAGLAVILDVVYNHLGPEGNYLNEFAPYFSRKHQTPWGDAFDYDGPNAKQVRHYILENVRYWITEFRLDGLRLDAVHFMFDDSEATILDDIRAEVGRLQSDLGRRLHLIAETNIYDDRLVRGELPTHDQVLREPRPPYDAIWCDDLMHAIYSQSVGDVALTHRTYRGGADLAEVLTHGFLYRGPDVARMTEQTRNEMFAQHDRSHLRSFVVALQTHDSVGNHPHGKRLHQLTSIAFQRAAAALVLLYPSIPMLFMGEEEATSTPFPFFVDFEDPQLRQRVDQGRASEYPQHQWQGALSPSDPNAFLRAQLRPQREHDRSTRHWYQALLGIRKAWVKSGILSADRFRTSACLESDVFELHYPLQTALYSIYARLSRDPNVEVVEVSVDGHVLLDSCCPTPSGANSAANSIEKGRLRLAAQQAVVMFRE